MKKCRTAKGLINAINKGERAHLPVYGYSGHKAWNWPVTPGNSVQLNLGNGRFEYVSYDDYRRIEKHLEYRSA